MSSELPTMPALRGLQRLRDLRPCVIVDSREQTPLPITRLPTRREGLPSGDYAPAGCELEFSIERKSIADLVSCATGENRLRFFRELGRLRGYRFARVLVVGERWEIEAKRYRSGVSPKVVLSLLAVIEARFAPVSVVFAKTPEDAARLVESWCWWWCRERVERVNDILRGIEREPQAESAIPAALAGESGPGRGRDAPETEERG